MNDIRAAGGTIYVLHSEPNMPKRAACDTFQTNIQLDARPSAR
jgi:hypothetical protein